LEEAGNSTSQQIDNVRGALQAGVKIFCGRRKSWQQNLHQHPLLSAQGITTCSLSTRLLLAHKLPRLAIRLGGVVNCIHAASLEENKNGSKWQN